MPISGPTYNVFRNIIASRRDLKPFYIGTGIKGRSWKLIHITIVLGEGPFYETYVLNKSYKICLRQVVPFYRGQFWVYLRQSKQLKPQIISNDYLTGKGQCYVLSLSSFFFRENGIICALWINSKLPSTAMNMATFKAICSTSKTHKFC